MPFKFQLEKPPAFRRLLFHPTHPSPTNLCSSNVARPLMTRQTAMLLYVLGPCIVAFHLTRKPQRLVTAALPLLTAKNPRHPHPRQYGNDELALLTTTSQRTNGVTTLPFFFSPHLFSFCSDSLLLG